MTISSTTVKVSYSGNGSTTVFAYTFKILDDDEIQVIIRSSTGTETVKTKTTDYTVSGVGSAGGGNITFVTAPTSTQTVVLRRLTTQTQETDYIANDPFPADSHEDALDRITMVAQEIQEELGRAIKLSKTNTMTSTEFTVAAADRANKILAFDNSGEISVTQELGTFRGNWATATSYAVRDLVKDTSTNNIFIVDTAHTSSGSQPLTTNANSAYYELIVDAASASASATAAAASASAASSSASAASSSASSASSSASAASSSASSAATAVTAAQAAQTAAELALDNFDDVYLGSKTSDPTLDNDGNALTAGDLYYNSVSNVLKYYTGSTWVAITSGGITDLVQDTTPQLGGSLDVNGNSIVSTSNGDITLQPNGTGDVVLSADTVKVGDSNVDAILTTDGTGDITISTNSGTNSGTVKIFDGVNGNIEITPNGSGVVKLDGLSYPIADGTANQVLKTNGSGVLSFATPSAGFSGATENAVSASALTLTSASTQYQKVQISSLANSYVTLPDATTLTTEGTPVYVIENDSAIGAGLDIKNNGGTTISSIPSSYIAFVSLIDNTTTNGNWQVNTVADNAVLNINSTVNSNTPTATSLTKVIHLTDTKLLVANFHLTSAGALTLYTKIGDLSGSTITFGSQQSTTLGSASTTGFTYRADVVRLSDSAFILLWGKSIADSAPNYSLTRRVSVNTVSGTTVTFGTQNALSFPTGTTNEIQIKAGAYNGMCCRMADDKFAVVYNTTIASTATQFQTAYSGSLTCNIITVSGTTLTVGTKVDLGSSTFTQPTTLVCHDTDRLCVVYYQATSATNGTGRTKVNIISVSGTTPTWGTSVNVEAADIASVWDNLFIPYENWYGSCSLNNMFGVALSTTSVVGVGGGAGNAITGYILISISGTTPTIVATKYINSNLGIYNPILHINSTTLFVGNPYGGGRYIYVSSAGFRSSSAYIYSANNPTTGIEYVGYATIRGTSASTSYTLYTSGATPNYIMTGTFVV